MAGRLVNGFGRGRCAAAGRRLVGMEYVQAIHKGMPFFLEPTLPSFAYIGVHGGTLLLTCGSSKHSYCDLAGQDGAVQQAQGHQYFICAAVNYILKNEYVDVFGQGSLMRWNVD